jgi:hypothetical protein
MGANEVVAIGLDGASEVVASAAAGGRLALIARRASLITVQNELTGLRRSGAPTTWQVCGGPTPPNIPGGVIAPQPAARTSNSRPNPATPAADGAEVIRQDRRDLMRHRFV